MWLGSFFFTKQCFCISSLKVSEVHSPISSCFQGNCLAEVQRPFLKYFLGMQKMPRTTKNLISYAHLLLAANIEYDINFYVSLLFCNNSKKFMAN